MGAFGLPFFILFFNDFMKDFKDEHGNLLYLEICSLIKTLCDDERTIMNLRYRLIAHNRVYHFNDTDIHNNPFDV